MLFAFFVFGDQNISTARVVSKNQVPTLNKDGLIKIGFKINESDTFKSFCSINKPTPEIWEKEITKIRLHNADITKKTRSEEFFSAKQWDLILEIVWNRYDSARNSSDLNGYVLADHKRD